LSVVWRTIRPSGMVRHLSYVRRIFMYHDAHMRLEYDVPFNTMTVPVGTNMTHHFLILTYNDCPFDAPPSE
jgi:hypothetical protein